MNESILAERREGRRVCPVCGATFNLHPIDHDGYHLKARVPKGDNETCDRDGAHLERREDDKPEIAERRMAAFHKLSLPMADFYEKKGTLISIEKTKGAAKLFKIIRPKLEELMDRQQDADGQEEQDSASSGDHQQTAAAKGEEEQADSSKEEEEQSPSAQAVTAAGKREEEEQREATEQITRGKQEDDNEDDTPKPKRKQL